MFGNNPKTQKEDSLKRRLELAEDPKTSFEVLQRMFFDASVKLVQNNNSQLFDAIIKNPNFQSDDKKIHRIMEEFSSKGEEQILSRIEKLKSS